MRRLQVLALVMAGVLALDATSISAMAVETTAAESVVLVSEEDTAGGDAAVQAEDAGTVSVGGATDDADAQGGTTETGAAGTGSTETGSVEIGPAGGAENSAGSGGQTGAGDQTGTGDGSGVGGNAGTGDSSGVGGTDAGTGTGDTGSAGSDAGSGTGTGDTSGDGSGADTGSDTGADAGIGTGTSDGDGTGTGDGMDAAPGTDAGLVGDDGTVTLPDPTDALSGDPSLEDTAQEETEAAEDVFAEFPGMGDDYVLTAEQLEDKAELAEHVTDIVPEDSPEGEYVDLDGAYVLGEVVYLAESEEEAELVAEAFGGDLGSYSYGVAVIELADDVPVTKAVAAAADEDMNLPAVWPNYYHTLCDDETDDVEAEEIDAIDVVSDDAAVDDAATDAGTEDTDIDDSVSADSTNDRYNDPYLSAKSSYYQWQHEYIGDSYAWTAGYQGQGVKVAVIDTGLRESHQDFESNRIITGKNFVGTENGTAHTTDNDDDGHGTHVAGIIAATADNGKGGAGIAPKAQISGFCVFAEDESCDAADILEAIRAAIQGHYDIINMSLGSRFYDADEQKVISEAYESGIAVFASAGNFSTNAANYPAALDGVISVAAIDETGAKAEFTNYGSTVDLAFPGVNIYSTLGSGNSSYGYMSGTSQASPAAAGTAAVILSARPDIKNMTGKARVDALLRVMQQNAIKCTASGMGAGTTYLPKVLGLTTSSEIPATPTITIIDGTLSSDKKYYTNTYVTAKVTTWSQDPLRIYYSMDGKTPTYKNGVVQNGHTLLYESMCDDDGTYWTEVRLGEARKVTLKVIAVNMLTGKASKVATKTVTLMPEPDSVWISETRDLQVIKAGKSLTLKADVYPEYASSRKVQWSIVEAEQAIGMKVSNGKVTTSTKTPSGTYTIQANAVGSDGKVLNEVYEQYSIQVVHESSVTSFRLATNKLTLDYADTNSYSLYNDVQLEMEDPNADPPSIYWSSSNGKVAYVSPYSGRVYPWGKGTAIITGTLDDGSGRKVTCKVTVKSSVTKITVDGPTKVAAGKSIQLKANVTPSGAFNKKVTWSVTSGSSLATINKSTGKLTAKKGVSGSCTIQATAADGSGTVSNAYTVSIAKGAITKIALSSTSKTLFMTYAASSSYTGMTLRAYVSGSSGASTSAVQFTSSAPGVVAVSQSGTTATLTAKAPGKATITCKSTDGSGKKATCTVNVNIPMSRIAVSPKDGYGNEVAQGKSLQLIAKYGTAYGTPTNKKLVWSSNSRYVTVSQSGKVTAKRNASKGTYKITVKAADGSGVTGYYNVRVIAPLKSIRFERGYYGVYMYLRDANNRNQSSNYYDIKLSGSKNVDCKVKYYSDIEGYYISLIPRMVTYQNKEDSLPGKLNRKYMEKVTVTASLKDGTGIKKSITVYVARDQWGNYRIYQ